VDPDAPPSLREQIAATFEAAKRLARAHIALARAEIGEIVGEVKRIVALAALAISLVIFVGLLLTVGLMLFLGEWLFGSIGWGVLLGTFLLLDLAAVALLLAVGVAGRRLGRDLLVAAVIGIIVGLVFGFDLTHRGWVALADGVAIGIEPQWRALAVAVVVLAVIAALAGFVARIRSGASSAAGAAVGAAVLGALLGLLTSAEIVPQVGAALGVLVGLIAWPAISGAGVVRTGIDAEGLKDRFIPDQSIDQAKETIEWLRARTPLAPKS
jgi:hypothetical protein